ncbi:MAG: hypothetical protein IJP91_08085 [Synergistaceae bacterium]|nr:hypothetical protein [Synergistaceae bacterium]
MDKNMAEVRVMFAEIHGEMKLLHEEIEHATDTLTVAINLTNDRIDDMKDYQNKWFTVISVLLGVLTVAFSALAFFK